MDVSRIRAILFDLDGTLLDTVADLAGAADYALARYGCPVHTLEEYRRFVGHGMKMLFRQALPEDVPPETFEGVLACFRERYLAHCTDRTVPYPGIPALLEGLKGRYRLGVFSNKPDAASRKVIAHYFPADTFCLVWGGCEARPLKPDPAAGPLLCKAMGLEPQEILFFGDGDTDMEFATRAGFLPVACSWGYRSREEQLAAGARRIVQRPEELSELLAGPLSL